MKPVLVSVIMGSDSDLAVMAEAVEVLEQFGIGHEDIKSGEWTQ